MVPLFWMFLLLSAAGHFAAVGVQKHIDDESDL